MITDELIKRCQQAERVAQKQLYEILMPYLNVVCRRYANNTNEVQDILQETFINIFSNINKYDSKRSQFKTWSVRIAVNCCLKNNSKTARLVMTPFIIEKHNQLINPEVFAQLSDEDLLSFFKTMPPKYFIVFNLNVIDGFNHKEIAEIVGIDESLSRKRLSRAREWLNSKNRNSILKYLGLRKLN